MFPAGLSMLWEQVDAEAALVQRFGLQPAHATSWLTAILADTWNLRLVSVERILLSAANAIAWVHTPDGVVVVKINAQPDMHQRLAAIAHLLCDLGDQGHPVAAPLPAADGTPRPVLRSDRDLSVTVMPLVPGGTLDVDDDAAVADAGAVVARLHEGLRRHDPAPFSDEAAAQPSLPEQLAQQSARLDPARAPQAHARLLDLLATLPEPEHPPMILHGDIRGANVLTADSAVTGILDFDEVRVGHPGADCGRGAVNLATQFHTWDAAPPRSQAIFLRAYDDIAQPSQTDIGWRQAFRLLAAIGQVPSAGGPWAKMAQAIASE